MSEGDKVFANEAAGARLLAAISLLGLFFGAFLITDGTFDFFGVSRFGFAYNHYLLSILHGRLDIPPEVLGREAFYDAAGRAYAYYGVFPAFLRLPFLPFLDLTAVCVSRAVVFACVAATGLLAQSLVRRTVRAATAGNRLDLGLLASGSVLVWFASPVTFLFGNASIYHETVVTGLLGVVVFAWLVLDDLLVKGRPRPASPVLLAVIAGVVLHCRPTLAIGLYVCVGAFCLLNALDTYAAERGQGRGAAASAARALLSPRGVLLPMLVLFAFGCVVLFMNWVRWGNMFTSAPMERYGYYLGGETSTGRMQNFLQQGRFNIRRILPSIFFNLFGIDPTFCYTDYFFGIGQAFCNTVYAKTMQFFGTGTMRVEDNFSLLLLWGPWLVVAAWVLLSRAPSCLEGRARTTLRVLVLSLCVSCVLMLSYPTVTMRYKAEYWTPLFVAFCLFACAAARGAARFWTRPLPRRLFFVLVAVAVACNLAFAVRYRLSWVSLSSDTSHFRALLAAWASWRLH
ncbi:hypothetical protein dsx2_2893 [Desulfovibrio sp. X2]|uniref:hypothetical protein n=1 Tax=Desulfovibrio sp. X2 TaxID=941449 RepID=UPI000358E70E|nr:hypothetical protein [Desulfovibrio sp. X2]EPR42106.1 hypothetical protein dsx2_2893 [Desulfovibrio sp. X2]